MKVYITRQDSTFSLRSSSLSPTPYPPMASKKRSTLSPHSFALAHSSTSTQEVHVLSPSLMFLMGRSTLLHQNTLWSPPIFSLPAPSALQFPTSDPLPSRAYVPPACPKPGVGCARSPALPEQDGQPPIFLYGLTPPPPKYLHHHHIPSFCMYLYLRVHSRPSLSCLVCHLIAWDAYVGLDLYYRYLAPSASCPYPAHHTSGR